MNIVAQALTPSLEQQHNALFDELDLTYSPESISDWCELQSLATSTEERMDELLTSEDLEISQEAAVAEFARLSVARLKASFGMLNGHINKAEDLKAKLKDRSPVDSNVTSELRALLPPKYKDGDLIKHLNNVEVLKDGLKDYIDVSASALGSLTKDSGIKAGYGWIVAVVNILKLIPVTRPVTTITELVRFIVQTDAAFDTKKIEKMASTILGHFKGLSKLKITSMFKQKITIHDGSVIDGAWINRNSVFGAVDVYMWGGDNIVIPSVQKADASKDYEDLTSPNLSVEEATMLLDNIISTQKELANIQKSIKAATGGSKSTGWEYATTTLTGYILRLLSKRFKERGNVGANLLKLEAHSVGSAFKFMDAYGKNADKVISIIEKSFK